MTFLYALEGPGELTCPDHPIDGWCYLLSISEPKVGYTAFGGPGQPLYTAGTSRLDGATTKVVPIRHMIPAAQGESNTSKQKNEMQERTQSDRIEVKEDRGSRTALDEKGSLVTRLG